MKQIKHEYFVSVELLLQWQGNIVAHHLEQYLSISNSTAKKILQAFDEKYPNATTYDKKRKCRITTDKFLPSLSPATFEQYLRFIDPKKSIYLDTVIYTPNNNHAVEILAEPLPLPTRFLDPITIRSIVKACKENLRVEVDYLSLNAPDFSGRIIQPHTFVFDGLRWHVRALDEKDNQFKDFNLARFNGDVEIEGSPNITSCKADDTQWNTIVDVEICADIRLSQNQIKCIEKEYQMENGIRKLPCRIALLNYLLLQLRIDNFKAEPIAQQIMLTNNCREKLKQYLW